MGVVELSEQYMSSKAETARRDQAREEYDLYKGEQLKYIEKNPDESVDEFNDRQSFLAGINITRHAIDSLAILSVPQVKIEGVDKSISEPVLELWEKGRTLNLCRQVEKRKTLNGSSFIRVAWTDDALKLVPWSADEVGMTPDEDDAREAATLWTMTTIVDESGNDKDVTILYTPDEIIRYENESQVKHPNDMDNDNPYGFIPVVNFRQTEEWSSPWGVGFGLDLTETNGIVNNELSDLCWGLKMQAHGQMCIKGWDGERDGDVPVVPTGPGAVIAVPEGGDAFMLNANYDAEKVLNSIKFKIQALYNAIGLRSADPVHIEIDASSGIAIMLQKADVLQYVKDQAVMMGEYYRDLIKMMCAVQAIQTNKATKDSWDPDKVQVEVTFQDPEIPVPTDEKLNQLDWDLMHDIITVPDVIAERDGISPEDARVKYQKNKAANDEDRLAAALMQTDTAPAFGADQSDAKDAAGTPQLDQAVPTEEIFIPNGAQITAAVTIIKDVSARLISMASARGLLQLQFPSLTDEQINKLLDIGGVDKALVKDKV